MGVIMWSWYRLGVGTDFVKKKCSALIIPLCMNILFLISFFNQWGVYDLPSSIDTTFTHRSRLPCNTLCHSSSVCICTDIN